MRCLRIVAIPSSGDTELKARQDEARIDASPAAERGALVAAMLKAEQSRRGGNSDGVSDQLAIECYARVGGPYIAQHGRFHISLPGIEY